MESVTEQQLLEEVRKALEVFESEDDAMTTNELAASLDMNREVIRRKIPDMLASGQFEACRVYRKRWDGILTKVSAIRAVKT